MAWTSSDLPAALVRASDDYRPCFLARNVGAEVTWQWQFSDGKDWSRPDMPTSRGFDRHPHSSTVAVNASDYASDSTGVYYLASTSALSDFDTVYIKLNQCAGTPILVQVQAANDADFTSDLQTIATFTDVPAYSRVASLSLGSSGDSVIKGSPYVRVKLTNTTGAEPPNVGYLALGRRRILNRRFQGAFDDAPRGAETASFTARGGNTTRYVYAECFQDFEGHYMPNHVLNALDDEATIRGIFSDCKQGRDPVIFFPTELTPSEYPHNALHGYIPQQLIMPMMDSIHERDWDFSFQELPPFQCGDAAGGPPAGNQALTNVYSWDMEQVSGIDAYFYRASWDAQLATNTEMTALMWIKMKPGNTGNYTGKIAQWGNGVHQGHWLIEFAGFEGRSTTTWVVNCGTTGEKKGGSQNAEIWSDDWYLLALAYDGSYIPSERAEWYMHGNKRTFESLSWVTAADFSDSNSNNQFVIGSNAGQLTPFLLNSFAIISDRLTTDQIIDLAAAPNTDLRTRDDLVFWWRAGNDQSEITGTTWDAFNDTLVFSDFSGRGNSLTLTVGSSGIATNTRLVEDAPA